MSKKMVLICTGIISVILISTDFIGTYSVCMDQLDCVHVVASILRILFIFLPLFLFSLMTYFLPEKVFTVWRNFAYVFVPLDILIVLLTPPYAGGLFPLDQGLVSFVLACLFSGLSLIIVIISLVIYRKKK